jgi:hypothetical protein
MAQKKFEPRAKEIFALKKQLPAVILDPATPGGLDR